MKRTLVLGLILVSTSISSVCSAQGMWSVELLFTHKLEAVSCRMYGFPDELHSNHPFGCVWLVDGVNTADVDLRGAARFGDGTTLHFRFESDVIAEVEAAIAANQ